MTKFTRLVDYDEFPVPEQGDELHLACCDCGLVHIIVWMENVETGEVSLRVVADRRATGQLRRHHYGDLHDGKGKWRLVREAES